MIVSTSTAEREGQRSSHYSQYYFILFIYHYTVGELSLESGTYIVIESEGSVEICLLLTGGVMSEDTDIILEVSPSSAKSGSE